MKPTTQCERIYLFFKESPRVQTHLKIHGSNFHFKPALCEPLKSESQSGIHPETGGGSIRICLKCVGGRVTGVAVNYQIRLSRGVTLHERLLRVKKATHQHEMPSGAARLMTPLSFSRRLRIEPAVPSASQCKNAPGFLWMRDKSKFLQTV